VNVAKDAKLAFTKAATIFVQYLSAAANDQLQKKSIIQAKHVLDALDELELSHYKGTLKEALKDFQGTQKTKKKHTTKKDKEAEATTPTTKDDVHMEDHGSDDK